MNEGIPSLESLTAQAFALRAKGKYAAHPVEATLQYFCAHSEALGEEGDGGADFQRVESVYRTGAQRLRLSEIPKLPENIRELSRLAGVDRAGCKALRQWIEENGTVFDETDFLAAWEKQGCRGGAEHHVYHDQERGRWFKRRYHGINHTTLGDYFERMRLHSFIFPETSYRVEGFTINAKSKALAPVVSQPHVEVDMSQSPVSKYETDELLAGMGFAPVQLYHEGILDDGYFAYLHPVVGVLAYDIHDENVVRVKDSESLAVIDPFISLARRGTWAALKLAQIGLPPPPDEL